MKRTCLDCGTLLYGRTDKKFCSYQCRNNYYNKLYRRKNRFMRDINNILSKNRRILEQFNPKNDTIIHKSRLEADGFNFLYFTNTSITNDGERYYFCYEYGYKPLKNDYYGIIKTQNNPEMCLVDQREVNGDNSF